MPRGATRSIWFRRIASVILVALIFLLLVAMSLVILQRLGVFEVGIVSELSGLSDSGGVLQLFGIGVAGAVLMLQALIANRRASAMEEAAIAQAGAVKAYTRANLNTEKGQRQERLKNAIEHLGNGSESVRLGGAYELFHLAEDTPSLRQTILDILCAHIRRTTGEGWYKDAHSSKPSEEIASLLSQLFVHGHQVVSGCRISLRASHLNGADLREARLAGADLDSAQLHKALLEDARLERADLSRAGLNEAQLQRACLREATLDSVHMRGAWLEFAHLQGALLDGARLGGASLRGCSLQGAALSNAELCGADLSGAGLEAAKLYRAKLQGAILDRANLRGAGNVGWPWTSLYADRIRLSTGKESNLSSVQTGGLEKDHVDEVLGDVESLMGHALLDGSLQGFVGLPDRSGLAERHGAILGSYGQEEAAEWIAEHESAMNAGAQGGSSVAGA